MQKNKVAIVVPSFNEEATIIKVYKKNLNYGKVLIIDDCSSDNTKILLERKKIKFLSNNKNIGYEASIIKGIKYILKNWKNVNYIVTMDADGELSYKSVPILIKKLIKNDLDIAVGYRNKTNRFTETILKMIFYFKFNIKDPISGLKIYKSEALKKIIHLISTKLFLVDILIFSYYYNLKIGSFKINVNKRKDNPRVGNNILVNVKILNIILNTFFSKKFYDKSY